MGGERRSEEIKVATAHMLERYGRFGYSAKAVVYIGIGLLGLERALGLSALEPSPQGTLKAIVTLPLGTILLTVVTVGLLGYTIWQVTAALTDGEHDGRGPGGLWVRLGKVLSAIVYGLLAFQSGTILAGRLGAREQTEEWTARVLSFPTGRLVILTTGAGLVVYGIYQFYSAYAPKVRNYLDLRPLSRRAAVALLTIGRYGFLARGVLFTMVGVFLARAALRYDAREASGMGEALLVVGRQPYGSLFLALVAVGLIAYGIYELLSAPYRRLDVL